MVNKIYKEVKISNLEEYRKDEEGCKIWWKLAGKFRTV